MSEEEKKILNGNNNDISFIYKALEKAGYEFLPDLRKKAGLEEKKRNASSSHEENRLFLPTRKAREEIKKFCGEDIRIFNNLFPAFNNNATDDIIFCALHRSYKLGKASSALGSKMREKLTNILEQIRNRAYTSNPWGEVLGASIFAQWPFKEYGLRLKGYSENLQNIKQPETSWGQRDWQALGSFFTQGRDAEVPERHGRRSDGQYTEESRNALRAEQEKFSNRENSTATHINVSNHQNTYWKMAAQGTISDDLKRKVDKLVSYLIAYYQTHGQTNKVNELKNKLLELTSVKIRPVDEQTGYIFDEFTNKIKTPTDGSYVNLRTELSSYLTLPPKKKPIPAERDASRKKVNFAPALGGGRAKG